MTDFDIKSHLVPASDFHDPVKVKEEDYDALQEVQVHVDALGRHRQEIGRLFQALCNLKDQTNELEVTLANKRRALANKYNLETVGEGQWAIDFEKKEFVRLSAKSPVIP